MSICKAILFAALTVLATCASAEPDWRTKVHAKGTCASYGICGHRKDGDVLNCANNTEAQPIGGSSSMAQKLQDVCPQLVAESDGKYCCTEEQVDTLATQIQTAGIFLVGCPACNQNFKHFFCTITCSADQSLFTNVTSAQKAYDNNRTVVEAIDVFISDTYGQLFYNSCKDVVYAAANLKAMSFIGGGAQNFQEFFQFLGTVKDKRVPPTGSPFQINFPGEAETPKGMVAANETVPPCWDSALKCSCGDCPEGPQCTPPPVPPPPEASGCAALGLRSMSCTAFSLIIAYIVLLPLLLLFVRVRAVHAKGDPVDLRSLLGMAAEGSRHGGQSWTEELLEQNEAGGRAEEEAPKTLSEEILYPTIERRLRSAYYRMGACFARHPWRTIGVAALIMAVFALGLLRFRVETDPQRLWVGPSSRAAKEKAAYEATFGPFYRIEQLILSTTPAAQAPYQSPSGLPAILTDANIRLLFQMQKAVDALAAPVAGSNASATLQQVCYKPLGNDCAMQSVLQFWKMDEGIYEHGTPPYGPPLSPEFCLGHWQTQCRATFEAPMDPDIILGGFPAGPEFRNYSADATAFVVTYPVDSSKDNRAAAEAWEAAFVELARTQLSVMAASAGLRLSFSSERSVADELARESYADVSTVAISYIAMLVYIAVALGYLPAGARPWAVLVTGRASLGLGGVLIVLAAVAGALGLCSLFGMWSTLIIMEVIPFLVLAVGVDNMFILANTLDATDPSQPLPERIGQALNSAGPSITLAATAEVVAFALGGFSTMPAVQNFSICAALAVFLDFCLQVTAFVALLALDAERIRQRRCDAAPCIQLPASLLEGGAGHSGDEGQDGPGRQNGKSGQDGQAMAQESSGEVPVSTQGMYRENSSTAPAGDGSTVKPKEARGVARMLRSYMAHYHAPALLKTATQATVLTVFVGFFLLSIGAVQHISRGLEQETALPRDSYLQPYYKDVYGYLRVGPPLLLVVKDLNMSRKSEDINAVCSIAGCRDDSLLNQVASAARTPSQTYIAAPAASWLDDFLSWISPEIPRCCRAFPRDDSYCPPPDQPPCSVNASACANCTTCFRARGPPGPALLKQGRPTLKQTRQRLPWFLDALPSEDCAKGGAGAYTDALQRSAKESSGIKGLGEGKVAASSFRTSYVPLNKQADFINGMQAVRDFLGSIKGSLGLDVYSFSVFHVFFEQYLSIGRDAAVLLLAAAAAVTLVTLLFTASVWASLLVLLVLCMILVDLLGVMVWWNIQLNAVSLVNLVMALGISVEFCAHVLHAFVVAPGTRRERMAAAVTDVGASVLSGITLTKFVGVVVLAFARTEIFEVYYFRVYFALVILGAAHSLVLLPVLLALAGPPPLPQKPGPLDVRQQ